MRPRRTFAAHGAVIETIRKENFLCKCTFGKLLVCIAESTVESLCQDIHKHNLNSCLQDWRKRTRFTIGGKKATELSLVGLPNMPMMMMVIRHASELY